MASGDQEEVGMCATCGFIASQRCGNCRQVFYCKKECQKIDWKKGHKDECKPYKIDKNAEVGRYLVANRKIKAGDIIMKDEPLVVGPHQYTEPICLACYKKVNGSYRCKKCTWPLCGPGCERSVEHKPECVVGQEIGCPIEINNFNETNHFYEIVTPLRCLTLKKTNPKKYEQLLDLESHYEERKNTQHYDDNTMSVVKMLRNYFLLHQYPSEVMDSSDEKIHGITGIIDTNAVDIETGDKRLQAVYPTFSIMEHSCIPNVKYYFTDGKHIIVKAAKNIEKGEHLCTMYTHILWGTLARNEHLKSKKYFMCSCQRCSDPSELGTNFSTLKCDNCPMGYLTSAAPLDEYADWICSQCNETITSEKARNITLDLGEEIEKCLEDPSITRLEDLLEKCIATTVHSNHFHLFAIRHTLLQLYGREGGLNNESIKKKQRLCQDFLKICTAIDPGMTKLAPYASVALFELHLAILSRVRQMNADPSTIKKDVEHAKALLKQCIKIMEDDVKSVDATTEIKLTELAKANLEELEAWKTVGDKI